MTSLSKETRQQAVDAVRFWFHSIDVGDGVVTPGAKSADFSDNEWKYLNVPELTGRTVLDIGAWDGWYSFAAEEAGAARVVSLDHYSWSIDFPKYWAHIHDIRARGDRVPDAINVPHVWQPEALPGKHGFDTARRLRGSKVEDVVLNISHDDLSPIGQFDVVLFAGVLYHLADPIGTLRQVFSVTKDVAVISTHAVRVGGFEDRAMAECFPHDEFAGDPTNWWVPNMKCLRGWCEAAGFSKIEVVLGPNETVQLAAGESDMYVAIVHAFR
jgi:tRNA (mo5U34)-methyltransferase